MNLWKAVKIAQLERELAEEKAKVCRLENEKKALQARLEWLEKRKPDDR